MTDPVYNNEPTVKLYGFRYPVIQESISRATVHKPDFNKLSQLVFDLITEKRLTGKSLQEAEQAANDLIKAIRIKKLKVR
jgi:hypothetical protein